MTYDLLKGLRVVEGSAFVAGPTCGLYLAQMGAEVIRFDQIGGGPDFRRWPLAGATAPEKYLLHLRIKGKYPQWNYWMSMTFLSPGCR